MAKNKKGRFFSTLPGHRPWTHAPGHRQGTQNLDTYFSSRRWSVSRVCVQSFCWNCTKKLKVPGHRSEISVSRSVSRLCPESAKSRDCEQWQGPRFWAISLSIESELCPGLCPGSLWTQTIFPPKLCVQGLCPGNFSQKGRSVGFFWTHVWTQVSGHRRDTDDFRKRGKCPGSVSRALLLY